MAAYRKTAMQVLAGIDALMVPTTPAAYTVAELAAEPVQLNSNLGTYTNCVNLLDLCGFAVPASFASDGTPFGVTFVAPSGQDAFLASLGRAVHAATGLPLGATKAKAPALAKMALAAGAGEIAIAVVGAHLSGMALNGELRSLGARFLEKIGHVAGLQTVRTRRHAAGKTGLAARRDRQRRVRSKSRSGR